MAGKNLGKLVLRNSSLFLCDMQEKFRPMIKYFPEIVEVSSRLFRAARILDIPVIVTEQYPKGLGPTVKELGINRDEVNIYPKTCFTMVLPEVEEKLKENDTKTVVLCGIETQVCVQQTTLDLLEKGYEVHVVADACSSRTMVDRMYAIERLRDCGAFITTSEAIILQMVKDAAHPNFKEIQKVIATSAPDSGLLS
ncbi:isochorismatase domain-containing protein 2 [Strongylocentrotus purpuratus]|uniref:Isochorismatase-like domain-containing protein n=1 Tax=Strongylocentrotus purpuratus TaxID=7668 RepID=A0A7M7REA1_STRPU|nr:isochorismatase domain-containing protein 2 [Strongylocentrotus purpuratus]|eukprot:XP_795064.1 PREDICTED: isochorismatase domain-containing protein 2, mitochondrial [Strongylocentrotus purpuratus]